MLWHRTSTRIEVFALSQFYVFGLSSYMKERIRWCVVFVQTQVCQSHQGRFDDDIRRNHHWGLRSGRQSQCFLGRQFVCSLVSSPIWFWIVVLYSCIFVSWYSNFICFVVLCAGQKVYVSSVRMGEDPFRCVFSRRVCGRLPNCWWEKRRSLWTQIRFLYCCKIVKYGYACYFSKKTIEDTQSTFIYIDNIE